MMRKISLDWWSVIASLLVASAVKFGVLGKIPW